MDSLKHFSCVDDVLAYASDELISTLQDDLDRMNGSEAAHYTDEDRITMENKIDDLKSIDLVIRNAGAYHRFIRMISHINQDGEELDDLVRRRLMSHWIHPCRVSLTQWNRLFRRPSLPRLPCVRSERPVIKFHPGSLPQMALRLPWLPRTIGPLVRSPWPTAGELFDMPNDDAVNTVNRLISEARGFIVINREARY